MNIDRLAEAKQRLPLPALLAQLGLGDHAKKSARCPLHEDSRSSFSMYPRADGSWAWKCHAGCGGGDEPDFLARHRGWSNADACREYLRMAGVRQPVPSTALPSAAASVAAPTPAAPAPLWAGWPACVAALTPEHRAKLATWRAFSPEFVEWLHSQSLVGLFDGERIAFPVLGADDSVNGCHYRLKEDGSWRYHPTGIGTHPLVLGDPKAAGSVLVFESQWDALAVMDKLGSHSAAGLPDTAAVITRGAANGKLVAGLCAPDAIAYAWPQNDPPNLKTGKVPAEEWFRDVCAHAGCPVLRVTTPTGHEDPNAWTKAGATAEDLWAAIHAAKPVGVASSSSTSTPDAADGGDDDGAEPPPTPFPVDALPSVAAAMVKEVARVQRNPPTLAACAALATLSAAVGRGLAVRSGPNRVARANTYTIATAPSGAGKSVAFDLVCAPLLEYERDRLDRWRRETLPELKAEIVIHEARIQQLQKEAAKADTDDERKRIRTALKHPQAELELLKQHLAEPQLTTEDVTIEALGDRLEQNHETIFSASADARKVADNLLGRMNPNKAVDDSLYLKGFTGDACKVDRKGKPSSILNWPCITILWLIQEDILEALVAERSLIIGGLLPRAFLCHTQTRRQKIEGDTDPIPETILANWHDRIRSLLDTYHSAKEQHVIQTTAEARECLRQHYNRTVDYGAGQFADLESFVARWTEQAWHVAVALHAGRWGAEAHQHDLSLETARAAITIVDWFSVQQVQILARGRYEAHKKLEDRVLEFLDDLWQRAKQDYITHRMVQKTGITRTAEQARALLEKMEKDGILLSEEHRRPQGGHVERRYRRKVARGPLTH
jgi:hypothetical protein